MPHHHSIADGVDSTTTRTAGQLRVLGWCELNVGITVEFGEFFDDDGARRHVDTQRECLGCENNFD